MLYLCSHMLDVCSCMLDLYSCYVSSMFVLYKFYVSCMCDACSVADGNRSCDGWDAARPLAAPLRRLCTLALWPTRFRQRDLLARFGTSRACSRPHPYFLNIIFEHYTHARHVLCPQFLLFSPTFLVGNSLLLSPKSVHSFSRELFYAQFSVYPFVI